MRGSRPFLAGQRGHVVADDDALGEGVEGGHAHAAAQLGVADEAPRSARFSESIA